MRGVCTSPLGVPFASREQLASTGRLQRCGGRSTAPVVPRAHASMQGAAAAQGPVAPVRCVLIPRRSRGLRACACGSSFFHVQRSRSSLPDATRGPCPEQVPVREPCGLHHQGGRCAAAEADAAGQGSVCAAQATDGQCCPLAPSRQPGTGHSRQAGHWAPTPDARGGVPAGAFWGAAHFLQSVALAHA